MSTSAVEVSGLSRSFGDTKALDNVSLRAEEGLVYGLVGANGAGKTTLIKHFLGLLKAEVGSVRIFGRDPVLHPIEVLSRIGYLSEERDLPEWMRIHELLRYTQAFHPAWDEAYARELLETFGLDPNKKVKELSKGMRAQAGLIAAVAHRPELLLLDEPSTGLDAIVRKDILNAVIRMVADDGRAVIFSSHLLDEVEQMSDYVFMVHQGRLVLEGPLDHVKEQHQLLSVQFGSVRPEIPKIAGILSAEQRGADWSLVCTGARQHILASLGAAGGQVTSSRSASLQEIFVARVGRDRLTTLEA
jgi:ABC-2 type transport system ATP-binding protein